MDDEQIAAEAAEQFRIEIVERHRWDSDSLVCGQLRNIIKTAIRKAKGVTTTEYAKGWDDHVAAVRASQSEQDAVHDHAWFTVLSEKLGSTQLSHAVAKVEALLKYETPTE